jgi:hypothetical protein
VRQRNGAVAVDPVRWFEDASSAVIPPGDGFLTWDVSGGTGVVRMTFADAGLAQRGLVNTASQQFSGLKNFNDGLTVGGTGASSGTFYQMLISSTPGLAVTGGPGVGGCAFMGPAGGGVGGGFGIQCAAASTGTPTVQVLCDGNGNAVLPTDPDQFLFVGGVCVGRGPGAVMPTGSPIDGGSF